MIKTNELRTTFFIKSILPAIHKNAMFSFSKAVSYMNTCATVTAVMFAAYLKGYKTESINL